MRAVIIDGYGATPQVRELPVPEPAPGEVRVRVRASSVNGFDVLLAAGALKGMYPHRFPVVLGKDFAGTVDELGAAVSDLAVGDNVFGVVAKPVPTEGGGFAQYLTTTASTGITRIPDGLDYATAGRLGLADATAIGLAAAAAPAPGETVLVSGATGGVGTLVVQLAAARSAIVIATASSGGGAKQLRELGAHHVVNHRGDLAEQIRRLAPGGVDTVVHLAGDPLALADLVVAGGRMTSALHVGPEQLAGRDIAATAVVASPDREVLDELAAEAAAGRLRSPVARTLQQAEVPNALVNVAAGYVGKLVVALP